ncbi:MAG: hypothetical protein WAW13_01655 [Minisyncoccia bacterium]
MENLGYWAVGLALAAILSNILIIRRSKKWLANEEVICALRKEIYDGREKCRVVQVRLHTLHHLGQLDGDTGFWITTVLIAPDDTLKACEKADRKIKYVPFSLAPKQILGAPHWQKVPGTPYVMILGTTYMYVT